MAAVKYYKSELTVNIESSSRSRNLLGVLISILVLLILSTVIVTAIVLINPDVISGQEGGVRRGLSLEEAFLHDLAPDSYSFSWSSSVDGRKDELLFECHKNLISLVLTEAAAPFEDPCSQSLSTTNLNNSTSQQTPKLNLLVSNDTLAGVNYQGYKFSPTKRYLLIYSARKRIFRHSFSANYYILDTSTNQIIQLDTQQLLSTGVLHFQPIDSISNPLNADTSNSPSTRFQLVDWFSTEDGKREGLVLIQDNDIYVIPSVQQDKGTLYEGEPLLRRLSYTGKPGELYNGHPDWLYEEEILSAADTAYQVSPQASSLAYMSFNDSLVELMPYSIYGDYDHIIPQTEQIRYPKTGRINPTVSVHVVDNFSSPSSKTFKLVLPAHLQVEQHYISRIKWLTEDHLSVIWLNRNQNKSHLLVCGRHSAWNCRINYNLSSPNGWLDMTDDLFPLDDTSYLAILPKYEGPEVGWFKHIARLYLDKQTAKFLTAGRREVTSIDGVILSKNLVYYTATPENEPGQRQTYIASLNALDAVVEKGTEEEECITCDLFPAHECLYNSVRMSPSGELFVVYCEGPDVPRIQLRSTPNTRAKQSSRLLWTMVDNSELRRKFAETLWKPEIMRLKVPIGGTSYSANVILLLPPAYGTRLSAGIKFRSTGSLASGIAPSPLPASSGTHNIRQRRSSDTPTAGHQNNQRPFYAHYTQDTIGQYMAQNGIMQYPMVVNVYGGPSSQKVDYRFDINLGYYLATTQNTIYAMIDGRGSANEGSNRMYELYHRFGTVEIQDQIDTAAYLAHNLSFVDPDRVAIWGWSYGGYAAAMALAKSNERHLKSTSQLDATSTNQRPTTKGIFECAASVAPVTDWMYYDTAYTERYMSSPYSNEQYDLQMAGDHNHSSIDRGATRATHQNLRRSILIPSIGGAGNSPESSGINGTTNKRSSADPPSSGTVDSFTSSSNFSLRQILQRHRKKTIPTSKGVLLDTNERYRNASLTELSGNIDKKRYLLIHGTADDNVHFQQSIMLMKRLISQNIMFETRIYPDQNHGISNRPDKLHLGTTLATFFAECFDMV